LSKTHPSWAAIAGLPERRISVFNESIVIFHGIPDGSDFFYSYHSIYGKFNISGMFNVSNVRNPGVHIQLQGSQGAKTAESGP